MTSACIQQRYPDASYSRPASAGDLAALAGLSMGVSAAMSPLYKFSDGFEMVIRGGEFHLQLSAIRDFESSGEFLVIGTDTHGADLVVDLSTAGHPVSWHCSFSRPIRSDRCEPLLPSVDGLLYWMIGENAQQSKTAP
jgi:hypothetical protein